MSAVDGTGVEALAEYLVPGRTAAFLGSSGVGKSTIINRLLGEERLAEHVVDLVGSGVVEVLPLQQYVDPELAREPPALGDR